MSTTAQWTKLQYITLNYITLHFRFFNECQKEKSKREHRNTTIHYTYTYVTYNAVSYCCDGIDNKREKFKHLKIHLMMRWKVENMSYTIGLANEMLIKCWFSVHHNVRGQERNFLFSGKYCVSVAYPEKKSGDQKLKV